MQGFDAIDYKLIGLLQENARYSIKHLAEQVFMSPPAIAMRLGRLEKIGAIKGYYPEIDPQMFGYSIMAFVNLQVSPFDKPKFSAYIGTVPNVLECNCVTGDYSMLIKACFHNTKELDAFIGDLQRFGKTYTQVVFASIVGPRGIVL